MTKARGCLLGGLVGDALGTTYEFMRAVEIKAVQPDLVGGGPFSLLPGQITDDSELALALARSLVAHGWSSSERVNAYRAWYRSEPFDCGQATRAAFGPAGVPNATTQSNGALMRVAPIAIYGAGLSSAELAAHAREDARLSHPSVVCQDANAAFVLAVQALLGGREPDEAYALARVECSALRAQRVPCDGADQGWVMFALNNAFYGLLHDKSFEAALLATVALGGDTDTNACIAGGLLGAHYGLSGIPERWVERVLRCKSPRPRTYHTNDAFSLADALEVGSLGAAP